MAHDDDYDYDSDKVYYDEDKFLEAYGPHIGPGDCEDEDYDGEKIEVYCSGCEKLINEKDVELLAFWACQMHIDFRCPQCGTKNRRAKRRWVSDYR